MCPSPFRVFCFLPPTGGHSSFPPYQRYCIPSPQRCHCLFFSLISPIIYLDQKSWFNNRKCVTPRSFPILLVAVRIGSLIQQIGNVMHLEVGTVSVGSLESPQFLERGSPFFKVPKSQWYVLNGVGMGCPPLSAWSPLLLVKPEANIHQRSAS